MLLVDAGPIVAAAARNDRNHERCAELLQSHLRAPLVVPALVVTEVAYLLGDRIGAHAESALARALQAGELLVEPPAAPDWSRIAELCESYRDLPLGLVDASLVAAAERLGVATIATLDHRHFTTVRPAHAEHFTLLP